MNQGYNDQYIILHKIGEGGMGTVYLAEDTLLQRKVAIKTLNKPVSASTEAIDSRFQQEALALARLNHPNITHLYSYVPRQDTYWMVMEYVDGKTLEDWLRLKGTVSPLIACSIVSQILEGLEHAHRKGIIHRDLKPANVMISAEGEVKIMDFGIARIRNSQRLTQHGKSVGTLEYMAPEQIQGKEGDEITDIYAAGNILYELLSGQPPFRGDTDYHLMKAKLEEKVPLHPTLASKVPPALQQIIFKALERNPAKRYGNVILFKEALLKSLPFPLLKEDALTDMLSNYQENAFPSLPQKKLSPVLEKVKMFIPVVPVDLVASIKKINIRQTGRHFRQWDTDKSMKLLVAVLIVCALLLVWNYSRNHEEQAVTIENNEPAEVVQEPAVKVDSGFLRQVMSEEPVANNPNPPEQQLPISPVNGGVSSPDKEKSRQKIKPGKEMKQPVEEHNKEPEPIKEELTPVPHEKKESQGPVSVPTGKRITVILDENLSSEEKSRDGGTVRLYSNDEVSVNGVIIIKKGATVTGKIVDVVPSTGRRKALIGFIIQSVQARDGSSVRVRSDRFRLKAQNDNEPVMYKAGSLFSVELGKGLVN